MPLYTSNTPWHVPSCSLHAEQVPPGWRLVSGANVSMHDDPLSFWRMDPSTRTGLIGKKVRSVDATLVRAFWVIDNKVYPVIADYHVLLVDVSRS